jgi:protein-S-isoprenylcysteine O-methyltransferase Ste14
MVMKDDVSMQDTPGVIAPPPILYAGGLLAGLLLHLAFPTKLRLLPRRLSRRLGASLIVTAILLGMSAFRLMRKAGTDPNPTLPSTALVVKGPFQFTRNPLYLSMALVYSGIALLLNMLWAILVLPFVLFVMRRGVIDREERYLERKFGEQYLQYKARVRRWL